MHATKLKKCRALKKAKVAAAYNPNCLRASSPDFFWSTNEFKKTVAAQFNERRQTREVGLRFHIFHHAIFDADVLLAVVPLVVQINELRRADGDIQRVNAGEIITGLFFEIHHGLPPPDFFVGQRRPSAKIFVWPA
jgi:hypothetical protein